jgi:transposase
VLANIARATPKTGDHLVEMIRTLKLAKDSAVKARTQAMNQIKAVSVTASPQLRDQHRGLTAAKLINACLALAPGPLPDPDATARFTLHLLATRHHALGHEVKHLRTHMRQLLQQAAPELLSCFAIAEDAAATLLITVGDNPHRLHSEAAFAALCGTSPSRRPPAKPNATDSTAAATAAPTQPSTAALLSGCAGTNPPATT